LYEITYATIIPLLQASIAPISCDLRYVVQIVCMPNGPSGTVLGLLPPEAAATLRETAPQAGLDVFVAATLGELLRELEARTWAATLVSLESEQVDQEVLQRIGEHANAGVLMLTAPALSLRRALMAERCGAAAVLRQPLTGQDLRARLEGAMDEGRSVRIPDAESVGQSDESALLVGASDAMGQVFETIARVARSGATVLLTGESGTGKEVVARALHGASDRRDALFVVVNCAAIPEHLLESELFGHEKGAFTGAVARREGRFRRAHGGTLFLDEIGDMSLVLQAKVLRALEERLVEPVGGETAHAVDVRVIAATNRGLAGAIREGLFREDLYYRLAVVELHLPPLRERGSDLRTLALHFARQAALRHRRPVTSITARALRRIEEAPWPGNVRELRNVLDRAVLLASGETIRSSDLRIGAAAPNAAAQADEDERTGYSPKLSLAEVESEHVRRVLESVGGHMARAADTLGIHRNTLTRKVRQYGIDVPVAGEAP
jgi:two-component system, NtrC family, response regulator HydG